MVKFNMTQLKNNISMRLFAVLLSTLLVACDNKEKEDPSTITVTLSSSAISQLNQPVKPANVGGDPNDLVDITRIVISVLQGDTEITSGVIPLPEGGTLTLTVPPHTKFRIVGKAYAGNELRFEGEDPQEPVLRPGGTYASNLTLIAVGEKPTLITIGGVQFNTSYSTDLSRHQLEFPALIDQTWFYNGYFINTSDTLTNVFEETPVNDVPSVGENQTKNENFNGKLSYAIAVDGAIYALQNCETSESECTNYSEPVLLIPAQLTEETTWPSGNSSGEVVSTNTTSPAGYTNTYHIRYTSENPLESWDAYYRIGFGLLDIVRFDNSYRRRDISPDVSNQISGNVSANGLEPVPDGTSISLLRLDNAGNSLGTVATGTIQSGAYELTIPPVFAPGSEFEIVVGETGLSSFYTNSTNLDISPITTAANRLIKNYANYSADAINIDEILEIEKTLRQTEQEFDMSNASETLDLYVDELHKNFLADLKTANILSSSFASGSLCGQVQDSNANNLAGITMVVRDFDSRVRRARTTTDNSGNYCVNVPLSTDVDPFTNQDLDGTYILGALNYTTASTAASEWWTNNGGAHLRIHAGKITVTDSATQTIDMSLQPGARIEGSVNELGDGAPGIALPGVRVIIRDKFTQFATAAARAGSDGSYRVNVLPGDYIIEARNSTFRRFASETYGAGANSNIRNYGAIQTVNENDVLTADFQLSGIAELLSGGVTDGTNVVAGSRVEINRTQQGGLPTDGGAATRLIISNMDGTYQVWLKPDLYTVYAYGQSGSVDLQQGALAQPLNFSDPVTQLPVIVQHQENFVSGAKARLYYASEGPVFKGTNFSKSDGSLTLYSNTNGSHLVSVTVEGQEAFGSIIYDSQTELGSGTSVSLTTPGEVAPVVNINLPDAGLLTGTVIDLNDNLVPNFRITVYQQTAGGGYNRFVRTRTRSDGTFALSLPQGVYAAVTAADENCINVPVEVGETTVIEGTYIFGDGGPCTVTQLPPSATTITGSVTSNGIEPPLANGTPISLLQLDNAGTPQGTVATGTTRSGNYLLRFLSNIEPGSNYEITVGGSSLSAFVTNTSNIDITPVTTAANTLIKTFPNFSADAVSADEILEVERTLLEVEQEFDMSNASVTLDLYVGELQINFKADLKTSNILSSSFASGSVCGQVQDTNSANLSGITMVAMDFETRIRRARTTTDSSGNYCINIPITGETDPLANQTATGEYLLGALNLGTTSMAASEWWTNTGGSHLRIDAGKVTVSDVTSQTVDFSLQPGARIAGSVNEVGIEGPGPVLPGVKVIIRDKTTLLVTASTQAGPDGSYQITVLPSEYIAEARNTTFRRNASQTFGGGTNSNILNYGSAVMLNTNDIYPANFELSPTAESISGTVKEADTTPVTGIRVEINKVGEGGAATRFRITKKDGSYQIWLKPDDYNVFTYGQSDNANILQLPHNSNFLATVAKLPVVVQHNGVNVSRAKVRLREDLGEAFPYTGSDISKSDGSVTLYAASTGNYKVNARIEGANQFASIGYNNKTQRNLGDSVALTAGQTESEIPFDLPSGGTLSGVISDFNGTGLANVPISVYLVGNLSDWDELVTTRSRSDGSFELSLPDGVYSLVSFGNFGSCTDVPIISGGTTTLDAEVSEGTICRISVTTNNITFNLSTSGDISQHFLNVQVPVNNIWPMTGYNGTTASYNYDFFSPSNISGIPTVELYDGGTIDYIGYALAYSTNGAIYALGRYFGDGGFESYVLQPRVYLPASLSVGDTWPTPEGDATNEVIAVGIDSPFGYTGTTHIRTTFTGEIWDKYIRSVDGIVEERLDNGIESYRRSDIDVGGVGVGAVLNQ